MEKVKNIFKEREGAALIVVIIAFVVLIILSTSVLVLMNSNLRQAIYQEHMIEAYYLAYSGIEMGYAALVDNDDELLNDFIVNYNKDSSHKIEENNIEFGEGKININITGYKEKDKLWIKIKSKGILDNSGVSSSMNMSFLADNKSSRKWKK